MHCYEFLRSQNKLFVIGFGGGQSTPGFLKIGWTRLFDMRCYFYPKIFSYCYFSRKGPSAVPVRGLASIETAVLNSNNFSVIHSHKSAEMFRWRLSNPHFRYTVLALSPDTGTCNSYLCYYVVGDKIILFDFSFENTRIAKTLTGELTRVLRRSEYKGIVAFCKEGSLFSKMLRKVNFISNPFPKGPLSARTPFIFYAPDEVMKRYCDPEKWVISSFDHDSM